MNKKNEGVCVRERERGKRQGVKKRKEKGVSGTHKNPLKRYRWGQQWCLFSLGLKSCGAYHIFGQVGWGGRVWRQREGNFFWFPFKICFSCPSMCHFNSSMHAWHATISSIVILNITRPCPTPLYFITTWPIFYSKQILMVSAWSQIASWFFSFQFSSIRIC